MTTLAPFTAKSPDGRSEATIVYDHLKELQIDDIVTYETLDDLLRRDFKTSRSPMYVATAMMEHSRKRTLEAVRNVGYRIVHANEHERLGIEHHRKARKQLVRAMKRVDSADLALLTPVERQTLVAVAVHISRHEQMLRSLNRRTSVVEEVQNRQADEVAALRAEVDSLKAQLDEAPRSLR